MGEFEARMPERVWSAIEHAERDEIIRVLKGTDGRIGGPNVAAAGLGVKRTTLISRMSDVIEPFVSEPLNTISPERPSARESFGTASQDRFGQPWSANVE